MIVSAEPPAEHWKRRSLFWKPMMNRDDAIRARRVILMDTSAYSTARDLLMPCVWCALFY